jgi:tol-pal system protein YbgF
MRQLVKITAASLLLLTAGCVTREDIRGIQSDLYGIQQRLESKTDSVQTSQADLATEQKELSGQIAALRSELQANSDQMSRLSTRLDDLEASLSARMDAQIELLSGSKFVESPAPSTLFNLANSDFSRGKYSDAIKEFEEYIKKFPKADRVPEARLKIGDAYVKQKETVGAIKSYDELISGFPKDLLVATALLRKAGVLESIGQKNAAKDIYMQIVKNYPLRPEATAAQERYRTLQSEPQ